MFTCGAMGCLPTVFRPRGAVFTCGAFGMFTSGGAEIFMPDGMGCIPPVVSPTLGWSKFEYTSGGSCGCACIIPPKSRGHLPPVGQRCLPAVLWVVYLRSSVLAGRCLPAVLTSTCGAFRLFTSGGAEMFMPDGMGVYTSGGAEMFMPDGMGVYTSGGFAYTRRE